jgi:hypothetical protein
MSEKLFNENSENLNDEHLTKVEKNSIEKEKSAMENYLYFTQRFLFPLTLAEFKNSRDYAESLLYFPNENSPKIKILRNIANYGDAIGVQDEIVIQDQSARIQYNFELSTENGEIIKLPKSHDNLLKIALEYNKALELNGSRIRLQGYAKVGVYFSLSGQWVSEEEYLSDRSLTTVKINQDNQDN